MPNKVAVFAFGRMNPPTIGHKKLVDKLVGVPGDHFIFLSQTQKAKTDPLDFASKAAFVQSFFPNVKVGDKEVRTIIQALQKIEKLGYTDIVYVAGSDRVDSFTELLNKYNTVEYHFNSIKIVSAGERDPDAEGAEGMSASKMRELARAGDFKQFKSGVPDPRYAEALYKQTREGMGIIDEAQGCWDGYKRDYSKKKFAKGSCIKENIKYYDLMEEQTGPHLYLDMDGVQADFFKAWADFAGVKHYKDLEDPSKAIWDISNKGPEFVEKFFDELDPLVGGQKIIQWAHKNEIPFTVLSAPLRGQGESSIRGKKSWLARHNPDHHDAIFTSNKQKYAVTNGQANVLVDDYGKYIDAWKSAGGIAIKHEDENWMATIKKLEEIFGKLGEGDLIPFPDNTLTVATADDRDFYELGKDISNLSSADKSDYGLHGHTVMVFMDPDELDWVQDRLTRYTGLASKKTTTKPSYRANEEIQLYEDETRRAFLKKLVALGAGAALTGLPKAASADDRSEEQFVIDKAGDALTDFKTMQNARSYNWDMLEQKTKITAGAYVEAVAPYLRKYNRSVIDYCLNRLEGWVKDAVKESGLMSKTGRQAELEYIVLMRDKIMDGLGEALANLRESIESKKKVCESVSNDLEAEFPGLDLDLYDTSEGYILSKISLPKDQRNSGIGTQVMQRIVDMADQEGKPIALTPDTAFGGSKGRLIDFYKRFGFVANKGRNKDFRFKNTMIRNPQIDEIKMPSIASLKASVQKLKKALATEAGETKQMMDIYRRAIKKQAKPEEIKIANDQFKDLLKMVGLGVLTFVPVPGGSLLLILVDRLLRKYNMTVFPSAFAEGAGITMWTNPEYQGSDVDDEYYNKQPAKLISVDKLVPYEPADKMNDPISTANMGNLVKAIQAGEKINPVVITKHQGKWLIIDGHHRYFAHLKAGVDKIRVVIADPKDLTWRDDVPALEGVNEGGWASTETQGTKITPALVAEIVPILDKFTAEYNSWVKKKGLDTVLKMGAPAGSATYYKRDLASEPDREYGDVDVNTWITPGEESSSAERIAKYRESVIQFAQSSNKYRTSNGTNVIVDTSKGPVQIDLILAFEKNANWSRALAPEHKIKGVISTSLSSSLAQALNLSFGGHGIQMKTRAGVPVPFGQRKDTKLVTVTNDPENWGIDIYRYFYKLAKGADPKSIPSGLQTHSGLKDEQRNKDIINVIGALATAFEEADMYGSMPLEQYSSKGQLMSDIIQIFTAKLKSAVDSSKYDKAQSPEMVAKANKTKKQLAQWASEFGELLAKA